MKIPAQTTQKKHRFHRPSVLQKQRTLRTGFRIGILLALVSTTAAKATIYTYQGTGTAAMPGSDNFSGTDFSPSLGTAGGAPVSGFTDTVDFGGSTTYTATDDFGSTVNANVLAFTNTGAVTLARITSGANSFTLGGTAPSIVLNNTGTVTNNLDLVLGNTTTVSGAGSMTLNGTISDGNNGYGLTMNGTGSLTLGGATNYLGNTTLNYGSVTVTASNVLSANSALVFGSKTGNSLNLGSTTQTVASLTQSSYIQNETIYGSTTAAPDAVLTVGGNNASTNYAGRLDGVALTKNGTGTLTLNGKQQNTNSALTLNQGTVILAAQYNNGTSSFQANGATVNAGTLQLSTGTAGKIVDNINDGTLVTMTGGTFDLNGQTETIGGLVSTGNGTVTNTSATATGVLTVGGNTTTSTFAGTITDGTSATELIKTGTGIQVLSGANTYTGGTMVNAGTLELGAFNSSPNSGTGTTVASGATLAVAVGGTSTITSANVATLATNVGTGFASGSFLGFDTTGGNFTESDNLAGAFTLNKLGANVLTLSGANTYTGGTTLSAGTLAASGAVGALPASSAVNMVAGTTLSFRNDAAGTIAQGNNILLTNASTVATAPTIDVRNNGGATTGSVVALGSLTNGSGTASYLNYVNFTGANGYTLSFTNLALPAANSTYLNPTTTSVSIGSVTNQITATTSTIYDTLFLNGTSTGNTITGTIADSSVHTTGTGNNNGATVLSVNSAVTGLGTTSVWTLTGQITYSGTTTVATGGALILNTPATSTSAGTVTVSSGGTLLGNGYAPTGLLTVASGAYLAPGATAASTFTTAASAGVLHVGALTLSSGSNFNILLGENGSTTGAGAGTSYSQLISTGAVSISGKLNLTLNGNLTVGDKFFILLNSGTTAVSGKFSNATTATFTSGGDTFAINYADNGDGGTVSDDISLTVTAVPEPSTCVGGLLTLAFGAWIIRRRMGRACV